MAQRITRQVEIVVVSDAEMTRLEKDADLIVLSFHEAYDFMGDEE